MGVLGAEPFVDEEDGGVFGEERGVGGGVEVGRGGLCGPCGFAERIADDGEAFAGAVVAGPGQVGDVAGGEAGGEERAEFVRVCAESEDGDEVVDGPEGDAVVDGFVERFLSPAYEGASMMQCCAPYWSRYLAAS